MNLSGNTNNNCLRLLNYLQQILKKKELEESLLLSENDNNFIVIPNNSDYLKKAQKYGQITGQGH